MKALDLDRALRRGCAPPTAQAPEPSARDTGLIAQMLAQRVELSQLTRKCFIRGRGFEDHEYRIAVYTYKRLYAHSLELRPYLSASQLSAPERIRTSDLRFRRGPIDHCFGSVEPFQDTSTCPK